MSNSVQGRIHSIETFGAVDGPGIRYVIFFQGCHLRCLYCHNPDSHKLADGKIMSSDELISDIKNYKNFIKTGGVTISGGEPLLQPEFALAIIEGCKENGIHTALDTSGAVVLDISRPVIDAVDMLLLDIKALDPDLCEILTGRDNKHTLATLDYCEKIKKPVWLRHVLVPGYTLDFEKLEELAKYLKGYSCIEKVELLPFHKLGEYKWKELGRDYLLYDTAEPTVEQVEKSKEIFRKHGLIK